MRAKESPAVGDRRHRVEGHAEVTLPFDVQGGIIMEYRSELPLDVIASGRDLNGDRITGEWVHEDVCRTISCTGFRYSRNSVRELSTDEANRLRALFGVIPIERFENNPKYFNVDLTLQKRVRLAGQRDARDARGVQFIQHPAAAIYEQLHVVSGTQQLNILSPLFGQYLRVEQPRAVQVTLQYDF